MKSSIFFLAISASLVFGFQAPAAAKERTQKVEGQQGRTVPRISVRWDCGACDQNPKVPPLIKSSYEAQAKARGYTVSSNETAEVFIKDYRQRKPATRVLLGAFAGKDRLATKLRFRGKEYQAKDSSANTIQGMNSLCQSIAKQTLAQVLSAVMH